MTQAEFDKQDKQVMRLANKETGEELHGADPHPSAHGAATLSQERARDGFSSDAQNYKTVVVSSGDDKSMAEKMRRHLLAGLRVAICAIIAALFLVVLTDPDLVVHLANLGILSCGIAAAIIIDRHFRR